MDPGDRFRLRTAFDTAAAAYDGGRPPHPAWVFDRLVSVCGLGEGSRVLEVGPGTGQATVPMARLGAHVTAVELGANLADRLRANTAGLAADVDVVVGDFETVALPTPGTFDLGFSANAFHWLDAVPSLRRLAEVLRPGGWLALTWNVFRDPERPDPFSGAVAEVHREFIGDERRPPNAAPYAVQRDRVVADIEAAGGFGPVDFTDDLSRLDFTTEEVVAMFATYSDWAALPDQRREDALARIETIARDQFGGTVVRPRRTVLYLAQHQ